MSQPLPPRLEGKVRPLADALPVLEDLIERIEEFEPETDLEALVTHRLLRTLDKAATMLKALRPPETEFTEGVPSS